MARCLLALGANLGDRRRALSLALAAIAQLPSTRLATRSTWHATRPVGGPAGQPEFLNGAALLVTELEPHRLLNQLHQFEKQLGRERHVRWNARTLDIDLLLYGRQIAATDTLVLPHPRMSYRRFVLEPAVEIAPWMVHPPSGWTLAALLQHLQHATPRVAVVSTHGKLAQWLAEQLKCRFPGLCAGIQSLKLTREDDTLRSTSVEYPTCPTIWPGKLADELPAPLTIVLEPAWIAQYADQWGGSPTLEPKTSQGASVRIGLQPRFAGPTAWITADRPQIALEEAVAAIESAWPDAAC